MNGIITIQNWIEKIHYLTETNENPRLENMAHIRIFAYGRYMWFIILPVQC